MSADDERDKLRAGRPRDYPRSRSEGVPAPIGDEESMPIYLPPGTKAPSSSRVRPYFTPEEFAEADRRRISRMLAAEIVPIAERVDRMETALDDYIRWDRTLEHEKANTRLEEAQARVRLEIAVAELQRAADGHVDIRKRRIGTIETVLITAIVTALLHHYIGPLL